MKILGIPFNKKHNREPGFHALIDIFFKEFPDDLHHLDTIKAKLENSLQLAQLNVVKQDSYAFDGHGLTGFYILSESHLSFHTWPENQYIAIDLFTCGTQEKTTIAIEAIKKEFLKYDPKKFKMRIVRRGFVYDNNN